jgi:hypothetical protein
MTIGWSIAVGDRPEVAVDGSDGEFTDPEAAQRGDDLSVEAVPVEPQGAGGAAVVFDLVPPGFGEHCDGGGGGQCRVLDGSGAVPDGFGECSLGGVLGFAVAFDLAVASVVVAVDGGCSVPVTGRVGADFAGCPTGSWGLTMGSEPAGRSALPTRNKVDQWVLATFYP